MVSQCLLLLLLLLFLWSFLHQRQLMVFHWSLSDRKSPQVSRTRLRILVVLRNAVIWIVSTRPPTSKSSRPFNNPLVIVPNAPITIGTIVTFMFHSFFNSLARSKVLILLFTFLQIYSVDCQVDNFAIPIISIVIDTINSILQLLSPLF